jgi:hypothetical protein
VLLAVRVWETVDAFLRRGVGEFAFCGRWVGNSGAYLNSWTCYYIEVL